VLASDFNYYLPSELIAQNPLSDRAGSRMLFLSRKSGKLQDMVFHEFPNLLRPDDLLVFNNTKVFPARLFGSRSGEKAQPISARNRAAQTFLQGRVEVLLTRQIAVSPNEWECLVRPGRKIGIGERLFFGDAKELQALVIGRSGFGERVIRFEPVADFFRLIEHLGRIPLPPYIDREDLPVDRERYQTIYASERGSAAAPTAGLHFTAEILGLIKERGIETTEITLHVGLGTFQPIRSERIEDNKLHREAVSISSQAADLINSALNSRRRIVAVGTTTVRALEFAARHSSDGIIQAGNSETDIFIYPGFEFRAVGAMLTNFHLPQSSLLMLVCAFADKERTLAAYEHAVRQKYRFYSYGDCMFLG
jgi:S-adenosylmethionine:tRNA ribosyltransferase-isomerase